MFIGQSWISENRHDLLSWAIYGDHDDDVDDDDGNDDEQDDDEHD